MALNAKSGAFSTGTGAVSSTVVVTGLGFQPKVILFFWSGATGAADTVGRGSYNKGFGVATSTSSRWALASHVGDNLATSLTTKRQHNDACVVTIDEGASTLDGALDLQSFDADGFTLVVDTQFTTSRRVGYLALGGADITGAATGTFNEPGATGNLAVTGVGFQPELVIVASYNTDSAIPGATTNPGLSIGLCVSATQRGVLANWNSTAQATEPGRSYCNDIECWARINSAGTGIAGRADFVSMDADGFTLNFLERSSTSDIFYLAINGGRYAVGGALTQTNTNNFSVTGLTIGPPVGLLVMSHCQAENTQDSASADDSWSVGAASSATSRACAGALTEFGTDPTEVSIGFENDEVYMNISSSSAVEGLMDLVSFNSDGFTLVMDDADPSQSFFVYLAIGQEPAVAPTISSVGTIQMGTNFVVTGDGFGDLQGTGGVTVNGVTQTISNWSNTAVTVTPVLGNNRYLTNYTLRLTKDGGAFVDATNRQVNPNPATTKVVTLTSLDPANSRITASADVIVGDQFEITNVVGGALSDVTVKADGSFVTALAVTAFDVRVNDASPGWGSVGTQTIVAGVVITATFGFPMLLPMVRGPQQQTRRRYNMPLW